MLALSALVGGIALADSINPSTVLPALYLAPRPDAGALARFIAGVFVVYLAGGLVLVLGPGPALMDALRHVGPTFEHAAEAAGGIALLVAGAVTWRSRARGSGDDRPPRSPGRRAALAVGAGISAFELPTAFMYFGAVSAVLDARLAVPGRIALVLAYNVIFVAPLLAILAIRLRTSENAARRLGRMGDRCRRLAPAAMAAVATLAGVALSSVGVIGLLTPSVPLR